MSALYLQKGGINNYTSFGVELSNSSYVPVFDAEYGRFEFPNAFYAPKNQITFTKNVLPTETLSFSVEREDTPSLDVPATTLGVTVIQYGESNDVLSNVAHTLCNGDKLYYEQEPLVEGTVKWEVIVANYSRNYSMNNENIIAFIRGLRR